MGRRHFTPEQIIHMLREAEINLAGREFFYASTEAKVLIDQWRTHYNKVRPHNSLGYIPPAPQAIRPPVMPVSATQH